MPDTWAGREENIPGEKMKTPRRSYWKPVLMTIQVCTELVPNFWGKTWGPECVHNLRETKTSYGFIDLPYDVAPGEWGTQWMFPLQNLPTGGHKAVSKRAGCLWHFPSRKSWCCLQAWLMVSCSLFRTLPAAVCLSDSSRAEAPIWTSRKENPTQGDEWENLWLINSPFSIEINVPTTAHAKTSSTPLDWKWCKIKKLFFKDLIPESQSQAKYVIISKTNAFPGQLSHSPAVRWGSLSPCINWHLNPNFIVSCMEKHLQNVTEKNKNSLSYRTQ